MEICNETAREQNHTVILYGTVFSRLHNIPARRCCSRISSMPMTCTNISILPRSFSPSRWICRSLLHFRSKWRLSEMALTPFEMIMARAQRSQGRAASKKCIAFASHFHNDWMQLWLINRNVTFGPWMILSRRLEKTRKTALTWKKWTLRHGLS